MKKISMFLSLLLIVSLLAGCAGTPVIYYTECTCAPDAHSNNNGNTNNNQTPGSTNKPADNPSAAAEALKTGLAISTSVKDSKSASAEDGEGKYDVTMVAVLVDDNGVIQDCKFKTFGCGAAIATSSMATEMVKGKTVEEARQLTNAAGMEALDGLPPAKVHCSVLAEEAIEAAIEDYYKRNNLVFEPKKKCSGCCGSCDQHHE